jgi:hypothetical protein
MATSTTNTRMTRTGSAYACCSGTGSGSGSASATGTRSRAASHQWNDASNVAALSLPTIELPRGWCTGYDRQIIEALDAYSTALRSSCPERLFLGTGGARGGQTGRHDRRVQAALARGPRSGADAHAYRAAAVRGFDAALDALLLPRSPSALTVSHSACSSLAGCRAADQSTSGRRLALTLWSRSQRSDHPLYRQLATYGERTADASVQLTVGQTVKDCLDVARTGRTVIAPARQRGGCRNLDRAGDPVGNDRSRRPARVDLGETPMSRGPAARSGSSPYRRANRAAKSS